MAKAGYDPREMLGVMNILKHASGGDRGPDFTQTHPLPAHRLNEIAQIIQPQTFPPKSSLVSTRAKR